jgi:hypothetical protein
MPTAADGGRRGRGSAATWSERKRQRHDMVGEKEVVPRGRSEKEAERPAAGGGRWPAGGRRCRRRSMAWERRRREAPRGGVGSACPDPIRARDSGLRMFIYLGFPGLRVD